MDLSATYITYDTYTNTIKCIKRLFTFSISKIFVKHENPLKIVFKTKTINSTAKCHVCVCVCVGRNNKCK